MTVMVDLALTESNNAKADRFPSGGATRPSSRLAPARVSRCRGGQIQSEPTLAHCWRGGYTYVAIIDPSGGGRIDACVLLPGAG